MTVHEKLDTLLNNINNKEIGFANVWAHYYSGSSPSTLNNEYDIYNDGKVNWKVVHSSIQGYRIYHNDELICNITFNGIKTDSGLIDVHAGDKLRVEANGSTGSIVMAYADLVYFN